MRGFRPLPKPLLTALATVFAVAAIFYAGLWVVYGSRGVRVELGFDNRYILHDHCQLIESVRPHSPAERAGLKPDDCIIALDGAPIEREDAITRTWLRHQPGDHIELTVRRPGISPPILLHATFRSSEAGAAEAGVVRSVGAQIMRLYPFVFLTVGLAVLFLRLEDPNAWLLALMFAGFTTVPSFADSFLTVPDFLQPLAVAYYAIFNSMVTAFFYFFFAVFPARSPIDRRLPWLKWAGLLVSAILALRGFHWGDTRGLVIPAWLATPTAAHVISSSHYALVLLGFVALICNAVVVTSSEARRKIRVILWGTLLGVLPPAVALFAAEFFNFHIGVLLGVVLVLLLWLFPLSFAYAVVKHRVLEIPALLRRSARYLLVQRGFVLLLIALSVGVTVAFALFFARYLQSLTAAAVPGGIALGTAFGTVLLWTGARVHKDVGHRIDRAFFRNAYDARMVLENLLEKTRTATDRKELAYLLQHHLKQALQPSSIVVYLETREGHLLIAAGEVPDGSEMISPADAALQELAKSGKPGDVSTSTAKEVPLPASLLALAPDCLVPIPGRDERLVGLIALGLCLSEEPYSSEDKRLLALIASQAGVALESILLGEKIAERIEAERRATQEMEFAREVQSRLLPQTLPTMRTLEYIGRCVPARKVGGDYYDFLELRPGRLGMVMADIAGKGVPGALLMANLQANLRSQYAMAVEDLPRLLASVNRLFFQSTDQNSYATLFFADYDDTNRVLRYANCGHLPALLLHPGNSSQQISGETPAPQCLSSTCTVLGLFEEWQPQIAEVSLAPGDTLLLYTDGVTEAANGDGEEFGEGRLVDALLKRGQLPVSQFLQCVLDDVGQFSRGEQQDDITLVIARCLP
jgi:sigma-B regulation protein RsbU (phosphoserine phosphatase)